MIRIHLFLCLWVVVAQGQTDIRLPPTVITGPEVLTYYRSGEAVTLECKANGVPAISYEWKKNKMDMNMNAPNIQHGSDGTFTFTQATANDEGYYQCFAKNQYGTAISNVSVIQRSVLDSATGGTLTPINIQVTEGEPFRIQAVPLKSVPKPTYLWEKAMDTVDKSPESLTPSKRIQIAENGDLHFAYALPEDNLGGKIYKCITYNEYQDIKAGGSYTSVTVNKAVGGIKEFAPTPEFSSPTPTVALEGGEVSLRCFFSGNPVPDIRWSGPKNLLPVGRYKLQKDASELLIQKIQPGDEGDYKCTGQNSKGSTPKDIQLRVEAIPRFESNDNKPRNVNVTEGDTVIFHCITYAKPEAEIEWLRNGVPLDLNNLPSRFVVTKDKRTLTIKNLCRDCNDRPDNAQSDLVNIQCNASNAHGYAFGVGYVNVLSKTKVFISSERKVEVEENEHREVKFECSATSDPSTPVSVRWFVGESSNELVHDDLPALQVKEGALIINAVANTSQPWTKYHGIYRCTADNGYSPDSMTVELGVRGKPLPVPYRRGFNDYWWILLLLLLILLLIIIILCCCICCRRNKGDIYDVDEKERNNGNDPEKELTNNGFQDYQRPEAQTLKGSQRSLGSNPKLNSDEEGSLLEYGDDPGKFNEDGSFVGAYGNTAERGRGRRE